MIYLIYEASLLVSIALMLFFGAYFIFGKVPPKPIFENYLRSRKAIGIGFFILVLNYMVHLVVQPRFSMPQAAILMNLSTYFLEVWLFCSGLILLLDKHKMTRKLFVGNIVL